MKSFKKVISLNETTLAEIQDLENALEQEKYELNSKRIGLKIRHEEVRKNSRNEKPQE